MAKRFYAATLAAAAMTAMFSGSASAQLLAPQLSSNDPITVAPGPVTNNAFNDNLGCFWISSSGGACARETDTVSNSSTSGSMALRTNETTAGYVFNVANTAYALTFYLKVVGAANSGTLTVKALDGLPLLTNAQQFATALGQATTLTYTATGTPSNAGWTEYRTETFTPTSGNMTFFFSSASCTGQSTTCFRIDEIRVPGPVPGAGLLSLAVLGLAAGYSRFRRRNA